MSTLKGLSRSTTDTNATPAIAPPASRWKTRLLVPGVIFLIVIILLLITSASTLLPAASVHVVPVVVKTVDGGSGTVTVQAPGWLEPDPHPYYVTALADGIVKTMLVLEGDRVEQGQVVAQMIDEDARLLLQRSEAELNQRRSDADAAAANLAATRLQLEHLVERSRAVTVAEASVAIAQAEIKRADADVAVERARSLEIQDEFDRKSKLTSSQAVSAATIARLRLRLEGQRSVVEATMAQGAVLEAKLTEAHADLHAATTDRRLLIEERRAVALAEAGAGSAAAAVALATAVRDEAALRLRRMEVRSPVDGVVMRRLTSPGSKLMIDGAEQSSHVLHVYDPKHMQVRVDVPLADAAHVSIGQQVEITVEVLPERTFAGTVSRLVHQADIQKNTVEVKVAIEDPSVELKPEMLARVRMLARDEPSGGTIRQRIFAPENLIRTSADGSTVAMVVTGVIDQRGRAERRSVTTGSRRIDGWIEIESGLQAGDLLIADPPADLETGDRVAIAGEQPMSQGGSR